MDQPDPNHPSVNLLPLKAENIDTADETHQNVLNYLWANGHFNPRDEDNLTNVELAWNQISDLKAHDPIFYRAVESWQTMRPGLGITGIFDAACHKQATAEIGYRCALPDIMPARAIAPAWPDDCKHDITTTFNLSRLVYKEQPTETINDAWLRGLNIWNAAADLLLKRVPLNQDARVTARDRHLGSYILAWSELATGSCRSRLNQAYNRDTLWDWFLLWVTIAHEIGHAIGIGHGGRGLMQPAHDPNFSGLDAWDLKQLIKRYGEKPEPPTPPTPGDKLFHHAKLILYNKADEETASFDISPEDPTS